MKGNYERVSIPSAARVILGEYIVDVCNTVILVPQGFHPWGNQSGRDSV